MKIAVAWIVVASAATSAQPVMHVICQEGPYRIAPFHMTIDVDTNTVAVLDNPSLSSDTLGAPRTTDATIEWTFMRGWAVFHRDTHLLEWDASDEYDYLDYIGQTPSDPRSTYAGTSKCTIDGKP